MARFVRICCVAAMLLDGCATTEPMPMPTVKHLDLPRFMGSWYVIASIPTFLEKNAYGAIESYARNPDGSIATTFTFHKNSLNGPVKTLHPRGFVLDQSNAVWGMQFFWPFKADYRIAHVDDAYSEAIVARRARDYVWIMARAPAVSPADYRRLVEIVKQLGYDVNTLREVPQS